MHFNSLRMLKQAGLALLLTSVLAQAADIAKKDGAKWQAPIPTVAENSDDWKALVPALIEHGMPYGALAAVRSMLNFFADLPSKELAYKTIVQLIDSGYPFPTRPFFIPGDIEPAASSDFGKNYFFYKALADLDKKMNRWALAQFEKVDKENFPKYIFYQALQAYGAGQMPEAIALVKKSLSLTGGSGSFSFAHKQARTLARFYYEHEDFDKALDIYQNFLLQLNPVLPGDWLEAAWCLYRLKRYPEALGLTYNLSSQSSGPTVNLEQYILRALIYREYCSVKSVGQLGQNFEKDFGKILDSIKLGEPLSPFPNLIRIEHPETSEYRQAVLSIAELESEQLSIPTLAKKMRPLAEYLYSSELKMLAGRKKSLENEALQILAKHLVILGESLRFLKFDVIREKFNPDTVFSDEKSPPTVLIDSSDEKSFRLHWRQGGDYWRDERFLYRGNLKNQCEK